MKFSTKELILCSIFASIIVILAQVSIPLPFTTVPLTMLIFGIAITGLILGSKLGAVSVLIYLLLGAIGLPVFANFAGGVNVLLGPTGGYLLASPLMAYIVGYTREKSSFPITIFLGLVLGLTITYIIGTLMFSKITGNTIYQSILYCIIPFIPTDIIKLILAYVIGSTVSKRISSSFAYSKN